MSRRRIVNDDDWVPPPTAVPAKWVPGGAPVEIDAELDELLARLDDEDDDGEEEE